MLKNQVIGERGGFVVGDGGQLRQQVLLGRGRGGQTFPQLCEPSLERSTFIGGFRTLNQAQRIARRESQAIGGERAMSGDGAAQRGIGIGGNQAGLRERGLRVADFDAIGNPVGALAGEPAGGKLIAKRPVGIRAEKLQVGLRTVRQNEAAGGQVLQLRRKLSKRENRKRRRGDVEFSRWRQAGAQRVHDPVVACVFDQLHGWGAFSAGVKAASSFRGSWKSEA